ncbi:MAG: hypothetical protein GWN61_12610 [candidate division Zixibacteria bacterium]|nr:PilZ domain-containing protein [candidate division Zixibacteria bacterium]NIU14968.1 PilZ domain-containing protein [candidate division Zixibacteria bacterium]NIV06987.1 hypothetical protein [candidate division Zixibacteria bacterium]NIW43023.1 hypothetical protein [candidate division Zixibacteria bacterium]NIX57126.1 hypothetical protein [candidate division Zixibacteria bacterium]
MESTTTSRKKRLELREYCNIKVEFSLVPDDCDSGDCGPWHNITSDISFGGMGIFSERPFEPGQKLNVYFRHVSSLPYIVRVVWCQKIDNSLYRVGLEYC